MKTLKSSGPRESSASYRILVVEDNPLFQEVLAGAVDRLDRPCHTMICSNGVEALGVIAERGARFDLALVDLGLPDIGGIQVIEALHKRFAGLPIMVVSVITSEQMVIKAIRAGAKGYISKSQSEQSIMQAIEDVLRGDFPISPSLARCLLRIAGAPEPGEKNSFNLTPRELETLRLLSRGKSYAEIAGMMEVALTTVQSHIRNLYGKLEVHSQMQAVSKAKDSGLI